MINAEMGQMISGEMVWLFLVLNLYIFSTLTLAIIKPIGLAHNMQFQNVRT